MGSGISDTMDGGASDTMDGIGIGEQSIAMDYIHPIIGNKIVSTPKKGKLDILKKDIQSTPKKGKLTL